jgi:putative heme iron utilization protein
MTDAPPPPRYRDATPEALDGARAVLGKVRYGTLATLDTDGHPMATRVGLARLPEGTPYVLVSGLSPHTAALQADPRCSLLLGEVGKGDPLAYPRLTLKCRAEHLPRTDALRATYLALHPKAALYIDLPDFLYFRMEIAAVNFIAGFGRAYRFAGADLLGR